MFSKRLVFSAALSLLVALSACARDPKAAYKAERGPHEVVVSVPVSLDFAELDKTLELRLTYPAEAERYPLILFSHGGRCSRDRYTDLAEHWASHGYVVIQPAHLDSVSIETTGAFSGTSLMVEAERTRRLDMGHILDSIDDIERLEPGLAGKIDLERVVASGHSMGGGTAMTMTGLVLVNPRDGMEMGAIDERFDALLLVTDPNNSPMMPENPWRTVALPTFVATGSEDFSQLSKRMKKGFGYTFRDDVQFADSPNHYLFIDGMDHYIGGLICREKEPENPDYEAMTIVNGTSTAFLDAYIKGDDLAMAFLASNRMPVGLPRASLETR